MHILIILIIAVVFYLLVFKAPVDFFTGTNNPSEMCSAGCGLAYGPAIHDASELCQRKYPNDSSKEFQCFQNSPAFQASKECNISCISCQ
ncbi:MAG TPA: hypothetical protein PKD85_01730 [Saprospiraceae bacterium]|nr:hypothetical protein [Saprospiraceae bacterium]